MHYWNKATRGHHITNPNNALLKMYLSIGLVPLGKEGQKSHLLEGLFSTPSKLNDWWASNMVSFLGIYSSNLEGLNELWEEVTYYLNV